MTTLFLGINLFLVITLAGYCRGLDKKLKRMDAHNKEQEKLIDTMYKDHPALIKADLYFSKELKEINAQLISMDNQLQGLENKRENDGGYQHALRILEMGGSKEEIVESCHLSPAEADLLMNLQAYRTAIKVK